MWVNGGTWGLTESEVECDDGDLDKVDDCIVGKLDGVDNLCRIS